MRELKCHNGLRHDVLSRPETGEQIMTENWKNAVCLALSQCVRPFRARNFGGPPNSSVRQGEWGLFFK